MDWLDLRYWMNLEFIDPTTFGLNVGLTIVASKGEDQTWFDYTQQNYGLLKYIIVHQM